MMRDNEYFIRFSYGRRQLAAQSEPQWQCELFGISPGGNSKADLKMADGYGGTMAGAMQACALNWATGLISA